MALISYLLNFLAVIFIGFRVYALLLITAEKPSLMVSLNPSVEIAILFVSILLIYLIFRRKLVAGIIFFGIYLAYYGTAIMKGVNTQNLIINAFGIIIAFLNFLDLLLNNSRVGKKGDKKTDWFYTNKDYERNDDSRKDKNRYRIM